MPFACKNARNSDEHSSLAASHVNSPGAPAQDEALDHLASVWTRGTEGMVETRSVINNVVHMEGLSLRIREHLKLSMEILSSKSTASLIAAGLASAGCWCS